MTTVIRLNANIQAPNFTKIKPPLDAEDYRIDCRGFESRPALEKEIRRRFSEKGAVLLVNTGLDDLAKLDQWGNILIEEPMTYQGGTQPRTRIGKNIYDVVTVEPAHVYLLPHNEMSYLPEFPQCLAFGCQTIPARGGETFIFDNRAVTREILQTKIGQKLKEDGVRYIRNLTDADRHGDEIYFKHWQDAFNVDSREQVEPIAQREGWSIKWMENNRLNISYRIDAYEYNESLGENLLFEQVASHGMYFDDIYPFNTLPYEERPIHITYGDGEPFTEKEIEFIVRVFDNHCLPIFWKPGWIALLDNERWAHARPPFVLQAGETRKLGVMMGNPKDRVGQKFPCHRKESGSGP